MLYDTGEIIRLCPTEHVTVADCGCSYTTACRCVNAHSNLRTQVAALNSTRSSVLTAAFPQSRFQLFLLESALLFINSSPTHHVASRRVVLTTYCSVYRAALINPPS